MQYTTIIVTTMIMVIIVINNNKNILKNVTNTKNTNALWHH